jgi:hypothetical protein
MFCASDCCQATAIQRYLAQATFDPSLIEEVHFFNQRDVSAGTVELDYNLKPTDPECISDPLMVHPIHGMGLVHCFPSMGAAMTWYQANKHRLQPWAPRRAWIEGEKQRYAY